MLTCNTLARKAILLLQTYIAQLGYKPLIHFELEGCFQSSTKLKNFELNYQNINQQLSALGIFGELVPEYWRNQWEYVSSFKGQLPLKEADNLMLAIEKIPQLLYLQGIKKTLIKPVVWSGDLGKLANGCNNIFSHENRIVHIPNAIQMNISATDISGENIIPKEKFGEYLQQCFMQTSLACCLLYLPEEEAFERLALKDRYGLSEELCSPIDISGGHQGSIALYKEIGKHNQAMGEQVLLYDRYNKVMLSKSDWQKTARIEHRLGASSLHYNAYINVVFGLLNLIDALEVYQQKLCDKLLIEHQYSTQLPKSLYDQAENSGAISLFKKDQWFNQAINKIQKKVIISLSKENQWDENLGDQLKQCIINQYQQKVLITAIN